MTRQQLVARPGHNELAETGNLFEELSFAVTKDLSNSGTRHKKNGENGEFKAKVKETARGFIASSVRRSPMIVPVVLEV